MDLKSKGKTWAGNIYQKFETMCHEVDNIMTQDTVRYVENKVHNVGESMKNFCSGVVQDLVPPSMDNLKCEARVVALKTNGAVGNFFKSIANIDEDDGHSYLRKQSAVEPSDFDPEVKQLSNLFGGLHPVNELVTPTFGEGMECTDLLPENFDKVSRKGDEFLRKKSASLIALDKEDCCAATSEFIDSGRENECASLAEAQSATPILREELLHTQTVGANYDNTAHDSFGLTENFDKCSRNEDVALSCLKGKSSSLTSPGMGECFEATVELVDSDCGNECVFLAQTLSGTSVHTEELQPSKIVGAVSDNSADNSYCVPENFNECLRTEDADMSAEGSALKERASSLIPPSEDKCFEESKFVGSNCENEFFFSETLSATSVHEELQPTQIVGTVCDNSADDSYYVCEKSDKCSRNEDADVSAKESASKEKSSLFVSNAEKEFLDATSEFIDCDCQNECVFLAESLSASVHGEDLRSEIERASYGSSMPMEHHNLSDNTLGVMPANFALSNSPVNSANHDSDGSYLVLSNTSSPTVSCTIKEMERASSKYVLSLEPIDSEMENIDLLDKARLDMSNKAKLEDSCVIIDDSLLYEVSRRTPKFRSYKKILEDAFTSRRRLTKEYKQLAIWYGDLDMEPNQDRMPNEWSSSSTITVDSALRIHGIQDCEWELL